MHFNLATAIACFLSAIHSIFFPTLLSTEPQNKLEDSSNTRFKCEEKKALEHKGHYESYYVMELISWY